MYEDVIEATENFDEKYCIGCGAYENVCKIILCTTELLAVKRIHLIEAEITLHGKEYRSEIQALTPILHWNFVKLYGFCSYPQCKFLIYEYMERGNLANILKDDEGSRELNWVNRMNIIKSSNVLLDSNFRACISDFGTARMLKPNSSNQTMLAGTHGYIAHVG